MERFEPSLAGIVHDVPVPDVVEVHLRAGRYPLLGIVAVPRRLVQGVPPGHCADDVRPADWNEKRKRCEMNEAAASAQQRTSQKW